MRLYFSGERIREDECGCRYDAVTNRLTAYCATHLEDAARQEQEARLDDDLDWAQDLPQAEEEDTLPW